MPTWAGPPGGRRANSQVSTSFWPGLHSLRTPVVRSPDRPGTGCRTDISPALPPGRLVSFRPSMPGPIFQDDNRISTGVDGTVDAAMRGGEEGQMAGAEQLWTTGSAVLKTQIS